MRKYSFIYSKLVTENNGIIGLLAYAIYKRQKIEHINTFKKDNGRDPSEDELDSFHQFTLSETQIQQYTTTAENDLNELANALLQSKLSEVESYYQRAIARIAKEKRQGFWYGVAQGAVGSLLYTLLLGVIFFILSAMQLGPVQVIEKIFHVRITQDVSSKAK